MAVKTYTYKAYGLSIRSDIALPHLAQTAITQVDLAIKKGKLPTAPALQTTKVYRGGLNARFAQDTPKQLWLFWSPLVAYMAVNGDELRIETDQTDTDWLALFTLSEALGLILFQRGYFLLHGSAVRLADKGVVFLGSPGAGKSTTVAAFAQRGVPVLADDLVCIRINERGESGLVPAFPQIKIWDHAVNGLGLNADALTPVREGANKFVWNQTNSFREHEIPLARIFVLTPPGDAAPARGPMPGSQVPIALLNHFPLPDVLLCGESLRDYFEKSSHLARHTPLFEMKRPADFTTLYAFVDHLKTML